MLKPQIYQHFTCPKSNNSFGPYYKILPHCFRAQLPEIIFLTKYNNLYENLHRKSNRCLCRRGKPDGIGLNWIFTKRCLFYFTYISLYDIVAVSQNRNRFSFFSVWRFDFGLPMVPGEHGRRRHLAHSYLLEMSGCDDSSNVPSTLHSRHSKIEVTAPISETDVVNKF